MRPLAPLSSSKNSDRSPPPRIRRKQAPDSPVDLAPTYDNERLAGDAASHFELPPPAFREAFCRRFAIAPERYEIEMLRRCLSRRARLVAALLSGFSRPMFAVDRLFIESIGRVRNDDELRSELRAFREHSSNRRWPRRCLKLRLSVRRVWDVADEVLPHLHSRAGRTVAPSNVPWN